MSKERVGVSGLGSGVLEPGLRTETGIPRH